MTHLEISNMIKSMGLPYAYYQFREPPPLPFVVYYYPDSDNFNADNKSYQRIMSLNIELYTDNKDFDKERIIEDVLSANDIPYRKLETYIQDEHMYQTLYESEVLINE